jgi:ABC-2 type transport system ATP-binding protein
MVVISAKQLVKQFGQTKALDNVSFDIKEGSITGFLGPNGAGKSTAMNILLGFIKPTHGTAGLLGEPASPNLSARKDIGFLSSNMALDRNLTAEQEIRYFAKLSDVSPDYGLKLAKDFKLDLKSKIKTLSTGNHQKVALIIALLAKPKLLILDEPTNGLDPLVQDQFHQLIKDLNSKGTTIFISSHILSEVSELCDNYIFIKKGKIIARVTKDELSSSAGENLIVKSSPEIINLLRKSKVEYKVEATDLEKVFMNYYEDKS